MGYKHTEEQNKKMVETRRKNGSYFHTPETRKKISQNSLGKKLKPLTEKHKKAISLAHKGKPSWNRGIFGEKSHSFGKQYCLGYKHTEEARQKMKNSQKKGAEHHNWKGGISKGYNKGYRNSYEYKKWRMSVFERDNFSCQFCGIRGVYITAHHIKSWAKYPELRLIIANGITLCEECHKLTDNYKGRGKKGFKKIKKYV
jgi:hypothetical protein